MELSKEDLLSAMELVKPLVVKAARETADQLDADAEELFAGSVYGDLDGLGWNHKYQAMFLRNYARNVEESLGK